MKRSFENHIIIQSYDAYISKSLILLICTPISNKNASEKAIIQFSFGICANCKLALIHSHKNIAKDTTYSQHSHVIVLWLGWYKTLMFSSWSLSHYFINLCGITILRSTKLLPFTCINSYKGNKLIIFLHI